MKQIKQLISAILVAILSASSYTYAGGLFTITGYPLTAPDGNAAAPSYSFANATNTGLYNFGTGGVGIAVGGAFQVLVDTNGLWLGSSGTLAGEAANVLALRNSTAAQTLRLYNTFTDASNYERLIFLWSGNAASIQTQAGGTGVLRSLYLGTTSGFRWFISNVNNLAAEADNAQDIGAFNANRPRNIYVGSAVFTTAPKLQGSATYTVLSTDNTIRNSVAATLTLPAVASSTGRRLRVVTLGANAIISSASNVVPITGGAAGTAILAATAGKWADLECDGANWIITASN